MTTDIFLLIALVVCYVFVLFVHAFFDFDEEKVQELNERLEYIEVDTERLRREFSELVHKEGQGD